MEHASSDHFPFPVFGSVRKPGSVLYENNPDHASVLRYEKTRFATLAVLAMMSVYR